MRFAHLAHAPPHHFLCNTDALAQERLGMVSDVLVRSSSFAPGLGGEHRCTRCLTLFQIAVGLGRILQCIAIVDWNLYFFV